MTVEPRSSTTAHIVVLGGSSNIEMNGCRLEASLQSPKIPIVFIGPESSGNVIRNTMIGHTQVVADFDKNPGIDVTTGKTSSLAPSRSNRLRNPMLRMTETAALPHWTVKINGVEVEASSRVTDVEAELGLKVGGFHVIAVAVNVSEAITLHPLLPSEEGHAERGSFGVYAFVDSVDGDVSLQMKNFNGISTATISTSKHTSDGTWQFVGMSALAAPAESRIDQLRPTIRLVNTGSDNIVVKLTAPAFTISQAPPVVSEIPLQRSGGMMEGALVHSVVEVRMTSYCQNFITLSHGNVYDFIPCDENVDGSCASSCSIDRINNSVNRFPTGTLITLLLPSYVQLRHGGYIDLLGAANTPSSRTERWTSTLIATNGGTWREVSRGN